MTLDAYNRLEFATSNPQRRITDVGCVDIDETWVEGDEE